MTHGFGKILLGLILICSPALAADDAAMRDVAYDLLTRLHDAPVESDEWLAVLDELDSALLPLGSDAVELLGSFLRELDRTPFYSCEVAFALARLGRRYPDEAVGAAVRHMPLPERSDDICMMGTLAHIGPDSYDALVACALGRSRGKAYWCALALVVQAAGVPGAMETMGLVDENGEELDPPYTRSGIRRTARRWKQWWSANKDDLEWSPGTMLGRKSTTTHP